MVNILESIKVKKNSSLNNILLFVFYTKIMPKLFDMNESNFENIKFGKLTKLEDSKYFIPIHQKISENIEPVIIQLNRCFNVIFRAVKKSMIVIDLNEYRISLSNSS